MDGKFCRIKLSQIAQFYVIRIKKFRDSHCSMSNHDYVIGCSRINFHEYQFLHEICETVSP